jgi:rhodanese-related sulfurtransferase
MVQLIISASLSSLFVGLFGVSWGSVDNKIEREFPAVSLISTQQLNESRQSETSSAKIFDVREPEEFTVSHLSGAINNSKSADIAELVSDKNAEIIVYCSVGYRSAVVADALASLGYTNVRNLKHSIFEWAEKGYPLVNSEGLVKFVHPFNRAWGALIDDSLHQYPQ